MTTKDAKNINEVVAQKVEDPSLKELILQELERRLANRPFWLKLLHFVVGNSAWLYKTVDEIADRYKEA